METVLCKRVKLNPKVKDFTNMITSDQDSSESSYAESPKSYLVLESPYSSPSQQVPNLAGYFTDLTCVDNNVDRPPYLRITVQPQNYFRFRYKSEMIGTHGCLLGQSYGNNKSKTHPTVELVNYDGRALIRCRLCQHHNDKEHPHKLLDEDQVRDVSKEVPEDGIYKVAFPGLGIIHTAKKDVAKLLFAKYSENNPQNERELRNICENEAKAINLNIVRLMFTAHNIDTGEEICRPVFSECIHNLKSAATNDLKICRMSRCYGRPKGGDDVYLLVEKVNKKNIQVRFYELSDDGKECWSANGSFMQSDVHHQYAIVFRTPQYRDPRITSDVTVYVELVRPSDSKTSEPKEFVYRAEQVFKQASKKRKAANSYSSLESSSGSSYKSFSDLPTPVIQASLNRNANMLNEDHNIEDMSQYKNENATLNTVAPSTVDLGSALLESRLSDASAKLLTPADNPMLSQAQAHPLPENTSITPMNSAEFAGLLNDHVISNEEKNSFMQLDLTGYFQSYGLSPLNGPGELEDSDMRQYDIIRERLFSDSARFQGSAPVARPSTSGTQRTGRKMDDKNTEKSKQDTGYDGLYSKEDGVKVNRLVKEICAMIRTKKYKKQDVRDKLEQLFEIRLSNGDTFLHMTLCNNPPSLRYIVGIVHRLRQGHLLNVVNKHHQTALQLAIVHDMPDEVPFLVSKGVDPMIADAEGNNAVHLAVNCGHCLEPLLTAIAKYKVPCDLDAKNSEEQTALHLAAQTHDAGAARLLLRHGAGAAPRDLRARTPLHYAAYDDLRDLAAVLVQHSRPEDIDLEDDQGYTPLQIVCGGEVKENSVEIIKILLQHNADPMKHSGGNESAWKMTRDKPLLRAALGRAVGDDVDLDADVKSEPEDEYESADDGDEEETGAGGACLEGSGAYSREVCALLDASGAWRELAARVHHDALLTWYENMPSPTRTLLIQLKELGENISSRSLALMLEDMGEREAAAVIRRYLRQ